MTDHATRKAELAEIVQSFDFRDRLPRSLRSREASIAIARTIDRDRAKHRVDRALAFAPIAISRSTASIAAPCRTQSPLFVPSSLNLTGFDDFFMGFVCVSVLKNE